MWQKEWNEGYKGKHFYSVQPILGHSSIIRLERKDSVVLTKLRLCRCALNFGLARIENIQMGDVDVDWKKL